MNSTPAFSSARGAADKLGILQDGEAKVRIQPLDCLASGDLPPSNKRHSHCASFYSARAGESKSSTHRFIFSR